MLFVELAVIRWAGANVVYLAASRTWCCWAASSASAGVPVGRPGRAALFPFTSVVLALFVAFIRLAPIDIDVSGAQLIFFNEPTISGPPRRWCSRSSSSRSPCC